MTAKVSFIIFFVILLVPLALDIILCCTVPGVGIVMIAGQIISAAAIAGGCVMYSYLYTKKRSEDKE